MNITIASGTGGTYLCGDNMIFDAAYVPLRGKKVKESS
jgi:hypothetical protein